MIRTVVLALIALGSSLYFFEPKELDEARKETAPYSHTIIGISEEGRAIDAYVFGNGEKHVLFVGGIHGGYEWNTSSLSYRLIEELQNTPSFLPPSISVTVIPNLNPDGLFATFGTTSIPAIETMTVSDEKKVQGRFNANGVDLNRNFNCQWQKESTWGTQTVSAGTSPFSEKGSQALREYIETKRIDVAVFYHSMANGVFGSSCEGIMHEDTATLLRVYAEASSYPVYETFDAYPITGDAEGYLAKIGIPAMTVELASREDMEWERNRNGIAALFEYISTTTSNP